MSAKRLSCMAALEMSAALTVLHTAFAASAAVNGSNFTAVWEIKRLTKSPASVRRTPYVSPTNGKYLDKGCARETSSCTRSRQRFGESTFPRSRSAVCDCSGIVSCVCNSLDGCSSSRTGRSRLVLCAMKQLVRAPRQGRPRQPPFRLPAPTR